MSNYSSEGLINPTSGCDRRIKDDTKFHQQYWNTAAVLLSWNRALTCWTLYQGSNSFGCHPLSYHSSEQRQTVCHRLGLHYCQWRSPRNGSIWASGWLIPDALAVETSQHKISTGVEKQKQHYNWTGRHRWSNFQKIMMMHTDEPTHTHIRTHTEQ